VLLFFLMGRVRVCRKRALREEEEEEEEEGGRRVGEEEEEPWDSRLAVRFCRRYRVNELPASKRSKLASKVSTVVRHVTNQLPQE
jgi:hypothetical protein